MQDEIWRTGTLIEFHKMVIQDESAAQQIHYIYLSDDDLLIDVYVYDNDHEDTIENILDSMEILYQAANAETEAASGENIQEETETGIPDTEDTKTAIRRTYGEVTLLDEKDNSALYENVRAMLELRDNLHEKLMSIGTDYVTTVFTPYYLDGGIFTEQDDKLYRELSDTPYIRLQTDTVQIWMLSEGRYAVSVYAEGDSDYDLYLFRMADAANKTYGLELLEEKNYGIVGGVMAYRYLSAVYSHSVENYPEEAVYLGSTDDGCYYYLSESDGSESETDSMAFYYLEWEGEPVLLTEFSAVHTLSSYLCDGQVILYLSGPETNTVVSLSADGNVWEILAEGSATVPDFYGYQDDLLILTYGRNAENETMLYTVTRADMETHETEQLVQTENTIVSATESENGVLLAWMAADGTQMLTQYDEMCENKMKETTWERKVVFAVEYDGTYYLSEQTGSADTEENLGGVYYWEDGVEPKLTGRIPFVTESNIIEAGRMIGTAMMWKTQNYGYLYEPRTGFLYLLDYSESLDFTRDETNRVLGCMDFCSQGEHYAGFSGVVNYIDGFTYVMKTKN